jgi:hypothetical protein
VPAAELAAAMTCHGDPASGPEPVLLNPATGVTPEQNYSWNYARAFTAQHRYWCWVTIPDRTLEDIQRSGEFLVHAIRTMHAAAGRRIAVMGHSQGGMSMRWALRFWPDTRAMVDDVIGMAGSNHGTRTLPCGGLRPTCPPADWQQSDKANFIAALNSGAETFAGISYTEIYSHTDEVVTPNASAASSSSSLRTGAGMISNVATQRSVRWTYTSTSPSARSTRSRTRSPWTRSTIQGRRTRPGSADRSACSRSSRTPT